MSNNSGSGGLWKQTMSGTGWLLTDECPYRLRIRSNGAVTGSVNWQFPKTPRTGLVMTGASAKFLGSTAGTGRRQGMTVGDGQTWPPADLTFATPTLYTWSNTVSNATTIPFDPASAQIKLVGNCTASPNCSTAGDLEVSEINLGFSDPLPPAIEAPAPTGTVGPDGRVLHTTAFPQTEWINYFDHISWKATDGESGILYTSLSFNGSDPEIVDNGCGYKPGVALVAATNFCPLVSGNQQEFSPFDPRVSQGLNTLELTTRDMSGNTTSQQIEFKVDTLAPDPPTNIKVDGNAPGVWRKVNDFDLTWNYNREGAGDEFNSGVTEVFWELIDLTDPSFQSVGNGSVVGDDLSQIDDFTLPGDGEYLLALGAMDRATNMGDLGTVELRLDTVVLEAPSLEPIGWVNRKELAEGIPVRWSRPSNQTQARSGICGYTMSAIPEGSSDPLGRIDVDGDVTEGKFQTFIEDGHHELQMRAKSCSGVTGLPAATTLDVDLSDPELSIDPATDQWLPAGQPVRINATDAGSGIDRIAYSVDGGPEVSTSAESVAFSLDEGEHEIDCSATDLAGNTQRAKTTIRVDGSAPGGAIAPFDPERPSLVRGLAFDNGSGVAAAWLEYENIDEPASSPTAFTRVLTPSPGNEPVELQGRLPAAAMRPGRHRIRLVARDHTGNAGVISTFQTGDEAIWVAPLLETPTLTAGLLDARAATNCDRATSRSKCQSKSRAPSPSARLYVDYGRKAVLIGKLVHADGRPFAGARLRVVATVAHRNTANIVGDVETGPDGQYQLPIPAGPSRLIEVRSAASETSFGRTATARLLTNAKLKLVASRKTVHSGTVFSLRGRVLHRGSEPPRAGMPVLIQVRTRDGWKLWGNAAQLREGGTFLQAHRLTTNRQALRLRMRALLKTEPGWPFAEGVSNTVTVVVKP